MMFIHAIYNAKYNCIDVNHYEGYILRIDCNKAESELTTTPKFSKYLECFGT